MMIYLFIFSKTCSKLKLYLQQGTAVTVCSYGDLNSRPHGRAVTDKISHDQSSPYFYALYNALCLRNN